MLQAGSKKLDIPKLGMVESDSIRPIAEGYGNRIAQLPEEEAKVKLTVKLSEIGLMFGGWKEQPEIVLAEAVRFVYAQYSDLGLDEILNAFRLKASGQLDLEGAEAYGGVFSVDYLGKVLTAYKEYRKKALAYLLRESDKREWERKKKIHKQMSEQAYQDWLKNSFEEELENFEGDWQDIPFHWYDAATEKGLLDLTKEQKLSLWEDAEEYALHQMQEQKNASPINMIRELEVQFLKRKEDRKKAIAKKLAVFRYLVLPSRFEGRTQEKTEK